MTSFYRGVVENNEDLKFLGRVQVRIMGVHSDSKTDAPTDSLPWAEVVQGTSFGGMTSGVGVSSILVQGTWVWLFFENDDWTKPIIFGTMIGQMAEAPADGFVGTKEGVYIAERLTESDLHPFNRSDSTGLIDKTCHNHKIKVDGITKDVENAAGEKWSELEEGSSKAVYPNNNVIETHGGHTIEIDDTEGNERIHIMHKLGTYIEIDKEGSITVKTVKDNYQIVQGNSNEVVEMNKNENVTGNNDLKIVGTHTEKITGDVLSTLEAKLTEKIAGDVLRTLKGTLTENITGNVLQKIDAMFEMDASGEIVIKSGATATFEGSDIKIGIGASSEPIPLGNKLLTWCNTHIHPTGVGPSGPANPPLAVSDLSAKSKVE